MSENSKSDPEEILASDFPVPKHAVERAIRCSYVQAMLYTIYSAFTSGMFVIGYALKLGANDVQIGLLSTIPMLCVSAQIISSIIVERGFSRRRLTIIGSLLNVLGWLPLILFRDILIRAPQEVRVGIFIAIVGSAAMFLQIANNARASWVGDLIPPRILGTYFGRIAMYAGIVGIVFAIVGSSFLDHVKHTGIAGFNLLFICGMAFGLLNIVLLFPQADVPITKHESDSFRTMIREAVKNRPLLMVMAFTLTWSMQALAAPFYATYMLRDLKMPFLGFSILNGLALLSALISAPFWGRIIDRYGCRPLLIACTIAYIPVPLVWIWMSNIRIVYMVVGPINFLVGFASSGISVALSTLLYKVMASTGRSVQLAVYSVTVTLLVAPLPMVGGYLPRWINSLGIHTDVRCTFYVSILFMLAAVLVARRIKESDALKTSEMVSNLATHIRNPDTLKTDE